MNKSVAVRWLVAISLLLSLSSCGGTTGGGSGVAEFKTVTVTAQSSTTLLESDVLTGNTCPTPNPPDGVFSTDLVPVTITSTVYPNFTHDASSVQIDSCTITYTPANSLSPALSDYHVTSIGTTVTAGGNQIIQVPVAPDSLKFTLVNSLNLQPCSATMYTYFATITFSGLEINTGTRSTFQATLNVAFADRTTKS